ncbi:MAG: hypothetical protein WKG07_21990 [Hymenobacter sp.]
MPPRLRRAAARPCARALSPSPSLSDSYLDMRQWGKGVVWINGHNLGRYWGIGPQQTIYVPAEWLRKGQNEVTVLELLKPRRGYPHQPRPRYSERVAA